MNGFIESLRSMKNEITRISNGMGLAYRFINYIPISSLLFRGVYNKMKTTDEIKDEIKETLKYNLRDVESSDEAKVVINMNIDKAFSLGVEEGKKQKLQTKSKEGFLWYLSDDEYLEDLGLARKEEYNKACEDIIKLYEVWFFSQEEIGFGDKIRKLQEGQA